tara:strand:+ start:13285 stop:14172 length:888 start_codon:yes stop_codon:yes gene_type:complete
MRKNFLYLGDAKKVLNERIETESIDLIITSPPYSDRRKNEYNSYSIKDYNAWFLEVSEELYRVLKPKGSFILNIKEGARNGEKETYVLELILALKKQGWYWIEEYCWHKKNAMPGKWPNRFRDAWERCLHFTKELKFSMYQEAVMIPIGEWSKSRFKSMKGDNFNEADFIRRKSSTNNKIARNVSNWMNRSLVYPDNVIFTDEEELIYPTNVLYQSAESGNKKHSAVFPIYLPLWFIKLFSQENDIVLDPFIGSGTTALAAIQTNRKYIGIDISEEFVLQAKETINIFKKEKDKK